ncbi:hypothetical protein [Bacillus salipaludis]|uniref:hypothetical protein n=1 Tax=Bacillus salipaludis TaxID=2547811 RepID=UPI002E1DEDE4|nr:hypothetical protein [Bacillus salipaludis]
MGEEGSYFRRLYKLIKGGFKKYKEEDGGLKWGLGIAVPFFFSSKFAVHDETITIHGIQTTHDEYSPIKYSIVKITKLGTSIEYFDSVTFYGDSGEEGINYTFTVPNGTGYQLEIFNYFHYHATGNVKMLKKELPS